MKKIAILTLPLGKNYGGILQNYALQLVLSRRGDEVITVAREKKHSYIRILLSRIKNQTYSRLTGQYKRAFEGEEVEQIMAEIQRFLETKLNVSEKLYSTKKLKEYFLRQSFDTVIVGSDQTWRPKYTPEIYNFYLDFLENDNALKKIAYASSFGTNEWEYNKQQTERCKKLIKQFDAVSVRESGGVTLCEKYFNSKPELVIDPTLLLSKQDYVNLFKDLKSERSGLLVFLFDKSEKEEKLLETIAGYLNLTRFTNAPLKSIYESKEKDKLDDYKYPSVESWLKSFSDADFIVTDSFHGTVFSIIFNKPFVAIVNNMRGASRFYSLLEMLGLQKRLITDSTNFDLNLLNEPIDYVKVNSLLEALKEKSYSYIDSKI